MQATTAGEVKLDKRYSPSFREDPVRRQSSTKRKRDEVLRLVSCFILHNLISCELATVLCCVNCIYTRDYN